MRDLADLSRRTEAEVTALHGMGPSALATLRDALASAKRGFATR